MLSQFNMNVINHLLPAKYDIHPTLEMSFFLIIYNILNNIIFIIMIRCILAFIYMLVYQKHHNIYISINMHKFSRPFIINLIYLYDTTMYFIGRVTLFLANNSLTECLSLMEFPHNVFKTLKYFLVHIPYLSILPPKSLLLYIALGTFSI